MAEVIKTVEDESSDSKPVDDTKSEKRVGDVKPAKRHLGIPQAVFLDDVESFMKDPGNSSTSEVMKKLDEQYQKYRYMEGSLTHKKKKLRIQIPDIKITLKSIQHLKDMKKNKETSTAHYILSDSLYATAEVPPTEKVYLWLGANVMLEYPIDEAEVFLKKNLDSASSSLKQVEGDLNFLREQITTMEVNMARVYNWDVQQRKKKEGLLKS